MKYTEDLLPLGYTITYENFNYERKRVIVTAKVIDRRGAVVGKGAAICAPCDEYIEERGMHIAAGRAIKNWMSWRVRNRPNFFIDEVPSLEFQKELLRQSPLRYIP